MSSHSRRPLGQSAVRTLILWVVFIVVFVGFYQSRSGLPSFWPTAIAVVVVGALVWFIAVARRWSARINSGVAHYNAGDFEAAAQLFSEAVRKSTNKQQRAIANMNLAGARLQLGQLEEGTRHYELADHSRGLARIGVYHHALPNHLATCYALGGDLEGAKRMLQEGEVRRGKAPSNFTLLPEVLVLCREEHFAAAVAVAEKRWREAEASGVRELKMLRMLQAFALDCVDPAGNAAAIAEALAGAKPFDAATVQLLSTAWPRMQAFLKSREIRPQPAVA